MACFLCEDQSVRFLSFSFCTESREAMVFQRARRVPRELLADMLKRSQSQLKSCLRELFNVKLP